MLKKFSQSAEATHTKYRDDDDSYERACTPLAIRLQLSVVKIFTTNLDEISGLATVLGPVVLKGRYKAYAGIFGITFKSSLVSV